MPLTACPECKKQISRTAKVCPSCGYSMVQAETYRFVLFLLIAGLLLYGLYLLVRFIRS